MVTRIATQLLFVILVVGGFSCASDEGQIEPPEMSLNVSSELYVTAGEDVIFIQIKASDPQDMELEFQAVETPERASFDTYRNEALFEWDPIISDVTDEEPHRLIFAVSNEAGMTTERTVHVHVDAGDDGTRFLSSSSQLYNPSSEQPLRFDVEVRNDAAFQVILSMPQAPEGATFEQVDDFEGVFEWMPNPEQTEQRLHHVVFEADDDEEVVSQTVTIVIQDPDSGPSTPGGGGGGGEQPSPTSCEGEQIIDHEPLPTQRTAAPYVIEGSIADSERDWDEALLYWSFEDPVTTSPDYETKVLDVEGQQFSGQIPNPGLDPGDSVEVSYAICAFANDDQDDGIACVPEEFVYRFIAYSPDDQKCRDDGIDLSEPALAAPISTVAWDAYRVCAEVPKYHELDIAAGEEVELVVSYPPATEPKIDISADGETVDYQDLPCIGLAYTFVEGPTTAQIRVGGDELPYHVTAFAEDEEPEQPVCLGQEYEPNNTPATATLIVDDFEAYDEMGICDEDDIDIFAARLVRGDRLDANLFFDHDEGDLDMTLFAPSQSDEVVDGGFGVAQGWSTDDDEELSYTAEESGFYYLSVVTVSEPNNYELWVDRTCEVDDEFAGNHQSSDAAEVSTGDYESLKLCDDRPDYYRLSPQEGGAATWLGEITLEYGSIQGLEATIYDGFGNIIAEGEAIDEAMDFVVDTPSEEDLELVIESPDPLLYNLEILEVGN